MKPPLLASPNVELLGAIGKLGAKLPQLRIGAEGVEAGHCHVELAAQAPS